MHQALCYPISPHTCPIHTSSAISRSVVSWSLGPTPLLFHSLTRDTTRLGLNPGSEGVVVIIDWQLKASGSIVCLAESNPAGELTG